MSEDPSPSYMVRDPQGNVYGPADAATLRQWVGQGRIVAGMHIAPRDNGEWAEVSTHPALADLFRSTPAGQPSAPTPSQTPSQAPSQTAPQAPAAAAMPSAQSYPVTPVADSAGMPLSYAPVQSQSANMPGVLSLISGLIGIVSLFLLCFPLCGCPIGGAFSLAAIILGGIALRQIKANPERYTGRGLAVAGLSMGICVILLYALTVAVMAIMGLAARHP